MDGRPDDPGARGPFGRSLFDDPQARALERVGVVDVGSNSVRMVVFDGAARSPAYFYNEKIMCALGAGMAETGRLNPEGKPRALAALKRFKLLAEGMGAAPLSIVATAAMREAEDGPAFRAEIERETGLSPWVIDGDEEARLSAQGVLLGWPGAYGMVCDIGGSSMELAELAGGHVGTCVSSKLGPLRLRTLSPDRKAIKAHIAQTVKGLRETMGHQPNRLFLVGGSWRAFARVDMVRRGYPMHVLHEYRMSREDVTATLKFLDKADPVALGLEAEISTARMDLLPIAALVLRELVKRFKPHDIAVSSYGIREGLLYEQMPQTLRDRDPLIEACRFAEAKDARLPGFGEELFKFIGPLFEHADEERTRIVEAACLLHDVSWRAHPDYRHEVCFDYATRANLGGLTHRERVFIGLALLHRYKNSRQGSRIEALLGLLTEDEIREAEALGKAMRFGAMFSGSVADHMGRLRWRRAEGRIEFTPDPRAQDLFGEVAAARFNSLAQTLGAEPQVILTET